MTFLFQDGYIVYQAIFDAIYNLYAVNLITLWLMSWCYVFVLDRVRTLTTHRRARLDEANTLHQFLRDIDDEEAWIK